MRSTRDGGRGMPGDTDLSSLSLQLRSEVANVLVVSVFIRADSDNAMKA